MKDKAQELDNPEPLHGPDILILGDGERIYIPVDRSGGQAGIYSRVNFDLVASSVYPSDNDRTYRVVTVAVALLLALPLFIVGILSIFGVNIVAERWALVFAFGAILVSFAVVFVSTLWRRRKYAPKVLFWGVLRFASVSVLVPMSTLIVGFASASDTERGAKPIDSAVVQTLLIVLAVFWLIGSVAAFQSSFGLADRFWSVASVAAIPVGSVIAGAFLAVATEDGDSALRGDPAAVMVTLLFLALLAMVSGKAAGRNLVDAHIIVLGERT